MASSLRKRIYPEVDALMHTDPLKIEIAITIYYQSKLSEFHERLKNQMNSRLQFFSYCFIFKTITINLCEMKLTHGVLTGNNFVDQSN